MSVFDVLGHWIVEREEQSASWIKPRPKPLIETVGQPREARQYGVAGVLGAALFRRRAIRVRRQHRQRDVEGTGNLLEVRFVIRQFAEILRAE